MVDVTYSATTCHTPDCVIGAMVLGSASACRSGFHLLESGCSGADHLLPDATRGDYDRIIPVVAAGWHIG